MIPFEVAAGFVMAIVMASGFAGYAYGKKVQQKAVAELKKAEQAAKVAVTEFKKLS